MTTMLNILLTVAGSLIFYLGSQNQQWLKAALPKRFRSLAYALLAAALTLWMFHLDAVTGFFTFVVLVMLLMAVFPLLSLFISRESSDRAKTRLTPAATNHLKGDS